MEFIPVESSNIDAVAYSDQRRELLVRFTSGQTYAYSDVPVDVYHGLMAAESKGKHLNVHIKGRYQFRLEG